MFASMFFFIFIGYPVAFIMGGLALIFAVIGSWLGTFRLIGLSEQYVLLDTFILLIKFLFAAHFGKILLRSGRYFPRLWVYFEKINVNLLIGVTMRCLDEMSSWRVSIMVFTARWPFCEGIRASRCWVLRGWDAR